MVVIEGVFRLRIQILVRRLENSATYQVPRTMESAKASVATIFIWFSPFLFHTFPFVKFPSNRF